MRTRGAIDQGPKELRALSLHWTSWVCTHWIPRLPFLVFHVSPALIQCVLPFISARLNSLEISLRCGCQVVLYWLSQALARWLCISWSTSCGNLGQAWSGIPLNFWLPKATLNCRKIAFCLRSFLSTSAVERKERGCRREINCSVFSRCPIHDHYRSFIYIYI